MFKKKTTKNRLWIEMYNRFKTSILKFEIQNRTWKIDVLNSSL